MDNDRHYGQRMPAAFEAARIYLEIGQSDEATIKGFYRNRESLPVQSNEIVR